MDEYRLIHKDSITAKTKEWNAAHPERKSLDNALYRERHAEKLKTKNRTPQVRARNNAYQHQRYHTDPAYRLKCILRANFRQALKLGRAPKTGSVTNLLGCTLDEFKVYIESLFLPGMTWDHGGQIHIDHIRPCASFDLTDVGQQRECFHYTNLRPVWCAENQRKGSLWDGKRWRSSRMKADPQ
jgi:hypothetical protein